MNHKLYKMKWNKIKIKAHIIKKIWNKNTQIHILVQHNYASMFVWLQSQNQEICKQHNATIVWTCEREWWNVSWTFVSRN
jgi:hypothetical protein